MEVIISSFIKQVHCFERENIFTMHLFLSLLSSKCFAVQFGNEHNYMKTGSFSFG